MSFKSRCSKCDRVFGVEDRGRVLTGCPYCGVPMAAFSAFKGQNRATRRRIAANKKRLARRGSSLDTPPEPDQAA